MSKTLQTVEEIATEKYPVHHIEDIGDINTEARIAFISGYKAANQAAQGYRDALEKIIHIIKDETLDISQTIDFAEETAQQTLSAAPTTQQTNGWISVEDRLPAIGEDVLAYSEVKGITYYDFAAVKHNGFKMQHNKRVKITHWQPLPLNPQP